MLNSRRNFIKTAAYSSLGVSMLSRNLMAAKPVLSAPSAPKGKRIGMIGLETLQTQIK